MRLGAVRRFRAWVLLATFVASLAQLSADHLVDSACGAEGFPTGSAARLGSPSQTSPDQHCAVCHFVRAVRGAGTVSVAALPTLDRLDVTPDLSTAVLSNVDQSTRPPRGPPSLLPTFVL